MADKETEVYDMGGTDAPDNKEREFLSPGYRKLTVVAFEYKPEEAGKTPLITMKCTGVGESKEPVEFVERFYISGKKNKEEQLSSVIRLQELYKGLTGNEKMTIKPAKYTYTKAESDGAKKEYTIPNPKELCEYLSKSCAGKVAVFKVGGEVSGEGDDKKIFSKLTYSGFLYYTDTQGNVLRYKEEGDFSDREYNLFVQKKKGESAPAGSAGLAATSSQLDEL